MRLIRRVVGPLAVVALCAFTTGCDALERARAADRASPGAVLAAADGDDFSACAEGGCEVRIDDTARIEMADQTGVTRLDVRSIDETTVAVRLDLAAGQGARIACHGQGCSAVTGGLGYVDGAISPGARLIINDLAMEVRSIVDGAAVLRLGHADT